MTTSMENFLKTGYAVIPAENLDPLVQLRKEIFEKSKEIFEHKGNDPESFFNNFHDLNFTGPRLNELRVKLINHCTNNIDSGTLIFEAFRNTVIELLGPDLLVQKNTNLVIQQPKDPNPSEVHRDAPANSPYEVVVWLPLVDCYATKGMYVLDVPTTNKALKLLDGPKGNYAEFENYCLEHGKQPNVPFGSALFFWTGILHGSRINAEKETRWTLNMRYKNLFSPNGAKEPFEFFKIFNLSPLTKIAIDFQKSQVLP